MNVEFEGVEYVAETKGKWHHLRRLSDFRDDGSLVPPSRRGPMFMISKRVAELALIDGRLVFL